MDTSDSYSRSVRVKMNTKMEALAEKMFCDNCEKECDTIYETADGDYVCLDCHIACPPEDD